MLGVSEILTENSKISHFHIFNHLDSKCPSLLFSNVYFRSENANMFINKRNVQLETYVCILELLYLKPNIYCSIYNVSIAVTWLKG